MKTELISNEETLLIRRLILEPGEAMHWHTDPCKSFTVIIHGSKLLIEFRGPTDSIVVDLKPGQADWDEPEHKIHRAVNISNEPYEEVVTFYRAHQGINVQPICK